MVNNGRPRLALVISVEKGEESKLEEIHEQIAETSTYYKARSEQGDQKIDRFNCTSADRFPTLVVHTVACGDDPLESGKYLDGVELAFTVDHTGCHPSKNTSVQDYFKEHRIGRIKSLEPNEHMVQYGLLEDSPDYEKMVLEKLIKESPDYKVVVMNHLHYPIMNNDVGKRSFLSWIASGRYGVYTDIAEIDLNEKTGEHLENLLDMTYPLRNGFYGFNKRGELQPLDNQNSLPGGEFVVGYNKLRDLLGYNSSK